MKEIYEGVNSKQCWKSLYGRKSMRYNDNKYIEQNFVIDLGILVEGTGLSFESLFTGQFPGGVDYYKQQLHDLKNNIFYKIPRDCDSAYYAPIKQMCIDLNTYNRKESSCGKYIGILEKMVTPGPLRKIWAKSLRRILKKDSFTSASKQIVNIQKMKWNDTYSSLVINPDYSHSIILKFTTVLLLFVLNIGL